MNRIAIVCVLVSVLAAATSRIRAGEPVPKDLRQFYQSNCVRCHGADGTARDAQGKSLRGSDLTDARWQKQAADAEMVRIILKGKFFGWVMPAYKDQLTGDEAQRLVTTIIRKAVKGTAIAADPASAKAAQP